LLIRFCYKIYFIYNKHLSPSENIGNRGQFG
jgi:hypothetical protein